MNLKARGELVTSVGLQKDKAHAPPSAQDLSTVYVHMLSFLFFIFLVLTLNLCPYNSNKLYWQLLGMTMFLIIFDVFDAFFGYFEFLIFLFCFFSFFCIFKFLNVFNFFNFSFWSPP